MNGPDVTAHLAAIVDGSDDAIISKDLDGIVRSFNAAAERMFGYTAAEMVGRPIQTLIPPERLDEEVEILRRLGAGERIDHFETVRMRKDGTRFDVSLTVSPIFDSQGRVVAASKIARDITERRRREALSAQLAAIVESSDDAILSKDLDGVVRSFNRAAERMYGYGADEVIGRSILMLIPRERHHEEADILARLRRGERIEHYETVRRRKDGTTVDVSLTVSPLRDASGNVVGASKVARDITERKQAAARLAAQQEWFRITLNSIGDAVIACDAKGRVTFLNHQAERLTGWTAAEAEHRALAEVFRLVAEGTRAPVESPVEQVLRETAPVGLANHTLLVARDGTECPIADSAAPIVDGDGGVLGVVVVFRDVSDAREDEARARAVAAERERLLESERSARNDAERANRIKDDFVAMVSHELRTPLNAILGWAQLLGRHGNEPSMLQQGIEVITRNTRLQSKLISDLLDVSRIVSGKLRLERGRVDLVRVIAESLEVVAAEAAAKGVRLASRLPEAPVEMSGDAARLQQIVLNLLGNAIKFTREGGGVDVELRADGRRAEISVTDTGVGIPAELLPDLFERFRQASPLTTRRYGGLGLGLSIARHLAELHGGSVRAHSAGVDRGATFTVELPLAAAQAGERGGGDAAGEPADLAGVSLRAVRALVVEDDQDTRDLIRRLLESYGAAVTVAASAPEALDLLERARPDVLISDIGLPDIDGYELIRRVRARGDAAARIPAIALTAFARPADRSRALLAGFNAHVAKPVESTELVVTVDSLSNLTRRG